MIVYVIVCSASLKLYVGQHKHDERLKSYLARKFWDAHHATTRRSHLYNAMRKHPRETWSIHPLIAVETKVELDECERLLIYALKAQHPDVGYNICDGGEGFTGPHSAAARQKMSMFQRGRQHTPEHNQKVAEAQRGVPKPEGFGEKIRVALTGREWTSEQREKIPECVRQAQLAGRMHRFTPEEMNKAHKAAANVLRGVSRSPEVMAACQSPEARAKRANALRGRTHSEEVKARMSAGKRRGWERKILQSIAWG